MSIADIKKVFVYGTLKRNYGLSSVMRKYAATWVGASSVKGYMLHMGGYPAIILEETGIRCDGEVWANITPELIEELDHIEGVPNHYHRLPIELRTHEVAWIYVYGPEKLNENSEIIPAGAWYGETSHHMSFIRWWDNIKDSVVGYKMPQKPNLVFHEAAGCQVVIQKYGGDWPNYAEGWKPKPIPIPVVTPYEGGGCIPGVPLVWAGGNDPVPPEEAEEQSLGGI